MRRLRNLFAVLVGLICNYGQAQVNLVPNPSFEDTINIHPGCRQNPHGCFLDEFIIGWRGKPVYFSEIFPPSALPAFSSTSRGVPSNKVGFQYAHSGIAYLAVETFIQTGNGLSIRSYVQAKLQHKLENGKKYKVEFYVSLADSMQTANNTIGIYFSPDSFSVIYSYLIQQTPQIQNDHNNSLNNDSTWVLVSDTLVADGSEQYITIGNFQVDSLCDTIQLNQVCDIINGYNYCASVYYIDDVSVTLIDDTGIEEEFSEHQISLYPNPAQHQLNITLEKPYCGNIYIRNMLAQEVYIQENPNSQVSFSIDVGTLPAGVYILNFENDMGVVRKKFVKE